MALAHTQGHGLVEVEYVVISGFLLISGLMAATYAINAWKIRKVTEGRALHAAALEGLQGLLFVIAIARVLDLTSSTMGAFAYVIGAFAGTAGAVLLQRRARESGACRCVGAPPEPLSDPLVPRDISLRPHVD